MIFPLLKYQERAFLLLKLLGSLENIAAGSRSHNSSFHAGAASSRDRYAPLETRLASY
jgi:hypothetical protein